jgi:dTDP-glucose pyrophosphorylase
MLPICNKPLVYQIEAMKKTCISDIIVGRTGDTGYEDPAMERSTGPHTLRDQRALGIAHAVGKLEIREHLPALLGDIFFSRAISGSAVDMMENDSATCVLAESRGGS